MADPDWVQNQLLGVLTQWTKRKRGDRLVDSYFQPINSEGAPSVAGRSAFVLVRFG
jgi:hypothetical protein